MKTINMKAIIIVAVILLSPVTGLLAQVKISNQSWKQKTLSPNEAENLAKALHFMTDGIAKGNLSVFDEVISSDISVTTGLKAAGPIVGLAEYKAIFGPFAFSWPVQEFVIDEAFATDDKVVIRFQAIAYFKNDYYGVKATSQVINMKESHILTFKNGKIINSVVGAINLPFEFIMYPVLKDEVLSNLPLHKN